MRPCIASLNSFFIVHYLHVFLHKRDPFVFKKRMYKGTRWVGKSCHSTEFFLFPQVMSMNYFRQKCNFLLLMWSAKLILDNFDSINCFEFELTEK